MIVREQVLKGLECLSQKQEPTANPCKDCGYIDRPNYAICVKDIASDAIALLKEYGAEYEKGFNDAMLGKQELMYEGIDGKWHKKDW